MFVSDLQAARFVVIARRIPLEKIVDCTAAIAEAGCEFLEITFDASDPDTLPNTAEKVHRVRAAFPRLHIGCGTVLTVDMARAAADAGAEYMVAPNTSIRVIAEAHRRGLATLPGAYTPCEIMNAWEAGADVVKIFPVQPGEEKYVTNVMSPLSHIPFMVTGGVTPETIKAMLSTGAVAVGAGASVFRPDLVEKSDYAAIAELYRKHMEAMR